MQENELELAQSRVEDLPEVQGVIQQAREKTQNRPYKEEELVLGDADTEEEDNVQDEELKLPTDNLVPPEEAEKIRQAREKQIEEELAIRNTPVSKKQVRKTLEALMEKRPIFKIGNICFQLSYVNIGQLRFSAKVINPLKND